MSEIDITNKFCVGVIGTRVSILMPPTGGLIKQDALLLAAYLVSLSNASEAEFKEVLDAVNES